MSKPRKFQSTTFDVEFGGYSSGKTSAAIGCKISRQAIPLVELDEMFTGAQLAVTIKVDPLAGEDAKGQGKLADTTELFDGTADVHSMGVKVETVTIRLSFNKSEVNRAALDMFSGRSGKLSVVRTGDAGPAEKPAKEDTADADE